MLVIDIIFYYSECYSILTMINVIKIIIVFQICLFLNELNSTEVTITASHCYDVNYAFLYSVSYEMMFLFHSYR